MSPEKKIRKFISTIYGILLSLVALIIISILFALYVSYLGQHPAQLNQIDSDVRDSWLALLPLISYFSFWLPFWFGLIPAIIVGSVLGITIIHPSRMKKIKQKTE